MKKLVFPLCLAILLTTVPLPGEVGQLRYTELDLRKVRIRSLSRRPLHTHAVTPPAAGRGTVHPQARAAKLADEPIAVWIALDSAKADAAELDLARFDFTNRGKFDDRHTVPMKKVGASGRKYYQIGPGTLPVPCAGSTVSVRMTGMFRDFGESRYCVYVYATVAAQGSCRFGDQVFGVLVIDGNGNLRLGDPPKLTSVDRPGKRPFRKQANGDLMVIDTSAETFSKPVLEVPCGRRVRIGQKWYEPSFSADGMKVSAVEVRVKTGKVLVPHDNWSMTLLGRKHVVLGLKGKAEGVSVPADSYVAANYRIQVPSAGSARPSVLTAGRSVLTGEGAKPFDVTVGKTTKVALGGPLTVGAAVTQKTGTVSFSALVTDVGGTVVNSFTGPGGKRPQPPTVIVDDTKGKEIYRGKMKFG